MNAREKLDEFIEMRKWDKNKLLGLSEAADFAHWYVGEFKDCNLQNVTNSKNYPHCWGKTNWILKYKPGEEPPTSICNCEHGSSACLRLTRENANK